MATSLFRRPRITLIVIVLISLTLLSVNYRRTPRIIGAAKGYVRDIVTPIRQAMTDVVTPVYDTVIGAFDYRRIESENRSLQSELLTLKNRQIANQGAYRSMVALSSELHIGFAGNVAGTPAMVISITPTNLQLSVELDKGAASGIRIGNPVVDSLGLVGRVIQVSSATSTVLLLDDPNFAAGVRFGRSGQIGLAVGQGPNAKLSIQLVDPGTILTKGEPVFTSGLQGEIFPGGIPLGKVVQAYTPPGALEERVEVVPVAPLDNLNYVSVLNWLPPPS